MTQTMQEQFEQAYSDDNGGIPVSFIEAWRLGDSYDVPRVARAWYWFKRSREVLGADLPTATAIHVDLVQALRGLLIIAPEQTPEEFNYTSAARAALAKATQ